MAIHYLEYIQSILRLPWQEARRLDGQPARRPRQRGADERRHEEGQFHLHQKPSTLGGMAIPGKTEKADDEEEARITSV